MKPPGPPLPPGVTVTTGDQAARMIALARALDVYAVALRDAFNRHGVVIDAGDFGMHKHAAYGAGCAPDEYAANPELRAALCRRYLMEIPDA